MPSVELDRVWVRFPLYGAWNRSPVKHLLWKHLGPAVPPGKRSTVSEALSEVSLSLTGGQRLAVLGSNGSGKTSLARVATGLIHPNRGRATLTGSPFAVLSIGCESHPEATVVDTIVLHALLAGQSVREARITADKVIEFGGLADITDRTTGELSSGTVLRMGLGTALFLGCDIIALDEVMDTADPEFIRMVKDILVTRLGSAIILVIERSRAILDNLCPTAIVLEKGRIIDRGDYDEILSRHRDRYTF